MRTHASCSTQPPTKRTNISPFIYLEWHVKNIRTPCHLKQTFYYTILRYPLMLIVLLFLPSDYGMKIQSALYA